MADCCRKGSRRGQRLKRLLVMQVLAVAEVAAWWHLPLLLTWLLMVAASLTVAGPLQLTLGWQLLVISRALCTMSSWLS
jgi:hypothetical protein